MRKAVAEVRYHGVSGLQSRKVVMATSVSHDTGDRAWRPERARVQVAAFTRYMRWVPLTLKVRITVCAIDYLTFNQGKVVVLESFHDVIKRVSSAVVLVIIK